MGQVSQQNYPPPSGRRIKQDAGGIYAGIAMGRIEILETQYPY